MTFRWTIRLSLFLLLGSGLVYACRKSDAGTKTKALTFTVPEGFPAPVYNFSSNPLTEEGFQLGRKLFYDGRLSKDGNFPCASCHQQVSAFANTDHDLSHGFNNQFTTRNAPPLFNLAWLKELQWDGGVKHIEVQPLAPITAPNEMAEDINTVLQKLKADSLYPKMFKSAFGDETITSQRMLQALTQFMADVLWGDLDVLVVDTAHGHSAGVIERVRWVKRHYPQVDVIGGNIATGAAARALVADAGHDAEAVAEETKNELRQAAFIGWQVYLTAPDYSKKPKKKLGFDKYLQKLGLAEKGHAPNQMSVEESKRLAEEADARVRKAFQRKPISA